MKDTYNMKKSFTIKTYDKTWVSFKHGIILSKMLNAPQFEQNINGWQWEMVLKLAYSFDDISFLQWDVIRVSEYDEQDKIWSLIYTWVISIINRVSITNEEYIELTCLWLWTLLNDVIVYLGSSYVPTLTQDPALTIKAIIDYFNTKYGGNLISYSWGNIDNFWTTISISYDHTNCFEAIKKIAEATSFRWYIDQYGQFYFKAVPTTTTHNFTFKKDVESIELKEDFEWIVNSVRVERYWWNFVLYTDVTSISTYGLKEATEHRTDLQDLTSQNSYGNSYIASNKNPKRNLQLTINSNYNIETIKPWDTITVHDVWYNISIVQVLKTSYVVDKIQLYLDRVITFGDMVAL